LEPRISKISATLNKVYFTQIVDNLISNAFKFTPAGKKVTIILERNENWVIFKVEDEGPGIGDELKDRLFHQYNRQTDMHLQSLPPMGLGLAIVHKYTLAMQGIVTCEDCPGGGTCFTVKLPLNLS